VVFGENFDFGVEEDGFVCCGGDGGFWSGCVGEGEEWEEFITRLRGFFSWLQR
jgi:hypothetical protein